MISRIGNKRGFSLLELMVVLVLIGLTSALVLPSMGRGIKKREVRRSALEIAAVARELRRRALYENSLQRLVLNPSENSYQALRKNIPLSSDIKITVIEGGEPMGGGLWQFLFFPNGSALGGKIGISGGEGVSYRISLDSLIGRVVVAEGRG